MAERMISVPDTDDEFLLYNNRTGKFEEHTGILDRTYDESKWEKVILKHLVSVLDLTGGTKTKVVGYFLKKKDFNNHIIATQQEIADSVGVSRPVVNQVVKVMIKNEFMKKKADGVYMLDPKIASYGSVNKYKMLVTIYKRIK